MSDDEYFALWLEGFCGLVCPFPRLGILPMRVEGYEPDWEAHFKEQSELLAQQHAYYQKKADAQAKWYAETSRRAALNSRGGECNSSVTSLASPAPVSPPSSKI